MRVLDGLPGLEQPDRFRSWLVAITVRQIHDRWRRGRTWLTAEPLEENAHETDPQADFSDLAILRLALSGQRREAVEATRWLEDEEREVLALWWMESAGELSRGELAAACGLTPQHAAVRVQRVKERLETARTVVRALTASPRCPDLAAVLASWDGRPSGLWRKRLARHVRDCPQCLLSSSDLIPAEGLLASFALVPVPAGLAGLVLARALGARSAGATVSAGTRTASGASRTARTIGRLAAKPAAAAAASAVTLAAAGVAWYTATGSHEPPRGPTSRPRCRPPPRPCRRPREGPPHGHRHGHGHRRRQQPRRRRLRRGFRGGISYGRSTAPATTWARPADSASWAPSAPPAPRPPGRRPPSLSFPAWPTPAATHSGTPWAGI